MDTQMMLVYDSIFCMSCNRTLATYNGTVYPWGHSHNLPKGLFPEFETEEWNIAPRCQGEDGCHDALDRHDFEKIKDFKDLDKIMAERKRHAPGEYNNFVFGLREVGCYKYDYVEF